MSNIKHYLSRSCLCGLLLAASLNSYSQITLNARGASVKSLIHQIETQSDYRFFFEDGLSGLSKKVNINAKDSLSHRLWMLFVAKPVLAIRLKEIIR